MNPKNIALVGFRLSGGGCGRVMANLSNYLVEKGIDVHIIIFHDELGYKYSGKLYNLGKLKSSSNTIFNKIKRFSNLRNYIKNHNFDFIIDFRFRKSILQEFCISKFIYGEKGIYTIHSSKLKHYLPHSKFWTYSIYSNCFNLITITETMKDMVKNQYPRLHNIGMIYNSVDTKEIKNKINEEIKLDYDYIIAVGQLNTDQKQFDSLIKAYSQSILPHDKIHLVILGEGKRLADFERVAQEANVDSYVHFLGFKINPYKYMKSAKFFVLSSWHEGHPMVLIEALSCGIPVISFDCPTGPNEVINHLENGLLVENQNLQQLINAMNLFIENQDLYKYCKNNSLVSVNKFRINRIGKQWLELMDIKCIN